MKTGKMVSFMLATFVAGGVTLALSADAEAHAHKKGKGTAAATRSNRTTGGASDNRMPDGDYTQSCKGFLPDFDGEGGCGPAIDLGDE